MFFPAQLFMLWFGHFLWQKVGVCLYSISYFCLHIRHKAHPLSIGNCLNCSLQIIQTLEKLDSITTTIPEIQSVANLWYYCSWWPSKSGRGFQIFSLFPSHKIFQSSNWIEKYLFSLMEFRNRDSYYKLIHLHSAYYSLVYLFFPSRILEYELTKYLC